MSQQAMVATPEMHQHYQNAMVASIKKMLTREFDKQYPNTFDVLDTLQTVKEKIKESEAHIGKPFYESKTNPGQFNFEQDVLAEMRELIEHDPHKKIKQSMLYKLVAVPVVERLALFSHEAAIHAVDPIIDLARSVVIGEDDE